MALARITMRHRVLNLLPSISVRPVKDHPKGHTEAVSICFYSILGRPAMRAKHQSLSGSCWLPEIGAR